MTRAVRMALAASLAALALGTSGGAFAAGCKTPTALTAPCTSAAADVTPVLDLTLVPHAAAPFASIMPLAISQSSAGDVVIDNADPISEYNVYSSSTAIYGYSSGGSVDITNQATGTLEAISVFGNATGIEAYAYGDVSIDNAGDTYVLSVYGDAIGLYGYSITGDVSISNSADVTAISYLGLADGIFASGADVDVSNSGDITATSVYGNWAAGIEAQATDLTSVDNSGSIYAYTGVAGAHAYGIYATGDVVEVSNSGNIEAQGYYATGIEARGDSSITITNDGDIVAGSAYYSAVATGINATSINPDGEIAITNNGSIAANGYFGGTGIAATATGIGGSASITNTGSIYASQYSSNGYGAYGMVASADGDASVVNSLTGTITAYTPGVAGGAIALSFAGDANATNAGDIDVYGYQGADGIVSFAQNGSAYAANTGTIEVGSGYTGHGIDVGGLEGATAVNSGTILADAWYAYGINANSGNGDVSVNNAGSIDAIYTGTYSGRNAFGVFATSVQGDVSVVNSGDINTNITRQSVGIFGRSDYGDVTETNSGTISAYSYLSTAVGMFARADYGTAEVDNSGSVSAESYYGNTFGVLARGEYSQVSNSGDIDAIGFLAATGIAARSYYGTSVTNTAGNISVYALGTAIGIDAQSFYGDVDVVNASDIQAEGVYYGGTGIYAIAYGDATVSNAGDIYATSHYGSAAGINGYAILGNAVVSNSGVIAAEAYYGNAFGIQAYSGVGDVSVANSGQVLAHSEYGTALGVIAYSVLGNAAVVNTGMIEATGYDAYGIVALADLDASVTNSGQVTATSEYAAVAILANAYGDATVSNSGDIEAISAYGAATGIFSGSVSGDAHASNSGNIDANGYLAATGIAVRSYYGASVTNTGGNISAYALGNAIGIDAQSYDGDVNVSNASDIQAESGYYTGIGISAIAYGDATVSNAGDIYAGSPYGSAIGVLGYSVLGNTAVSNSGTIEATGYYGAYGVAAFSYLGDVSVSNSGQVTATSPYTAVGILAGAYGDVTVNNSGTIMAIADGGDASVAAVQMESLYGQSTLNNASTGSISVDGTEGYAFAVVGSDAVDIINNSGLITGAVTLYGGDDVFNNLSGGVWDVGATYSTDFGDGDDTINNRAGGLIRFDGGAIYLGSSVDGNAFNNSGTIKVNGDSLIDMGSGPVALVPSLNPLPLINNGVIDMVDGVADDSLTIVGDLGGNGSLNIDVMVPNGPADELHVDGSVVAGAVQTVNAYFSPSLLVAAQTGAFVDFGFVSGNSTAGSFVGGNVIGYDPSNFLALDVVITSQINTANTADDVFSIGVDVTGLNDTGTLAASVASGAAGMLNAQIGTFKQRMGVNPYGDADKVMSAFFRTYTSEGDVNPTHAMTNFGQGGHFDYDQSVWGREVGVNANLYGNFHAGVVLGTADGRQRLTGAGIGQNRMDGSTFGVYATWFAPQGFYVDVSGRWMAVDVRSTSAAGTLQTRAHTGAWNIESGYQWTLGGLSIVPQLQYTRTKVDGVRPIYGSAATFESHGGTSSRGRVGVEVNKTFESGGIRWTPYGSINAIREFDGDMNYTVANVFNGGTGTKGTSTMAELGLGVQKGAWGFTIGANWLDGGAYKSTVGGQALVRFAW
ncbi:MAG: hypothetical protein ABIP16_04120 [Thermomonas sp.]